MNNKARRGISRLAFLGRDFICADVCDICICVCVCVCVCVCDDASFRPPSIFAPAKEDTRDLNRAQRRCDEQRASAALICAGRIKT